MKNKKITKEDVLKMSHSELIELCSDDCNDCSNCINCSYCNNCNNCSYCDDCSNCSYCNYCNNIYKKEFMIANVQFTKEEYNKWLSERSRK